MGKGGQNSSAKSDLNKLNPELAAKTFFTRDEVRKHNQKDDIWLIINEKVYNVTEFLSKHPGGQRVLRIYGGEDATEAFNAFHKEFDKVLRYSKMYHIGQIYPNETLSSLTPDATSTDQKKIQSLKEMRADILSLRKVFVDMGLFEANYLFFILHGMHIVFFQILGFYILWNYGCGYVALGCALICHIIAQAQAAWTQHDYGHSSILAKPKHNQYIQMFFLGLIKGASADWWSYMHNQHHAKPNVLNVDPDVRLAPVFVLGNTEPKRRAERNASGKEMVIYNYSFQQYYFPLTAPLLFPLFFQITTIRHAIKNKRYLDLLSIILMFIIQFSLTYPVFGSMSKAACYFLVVRFFESSWFVWVSQSNHIPMDVHDNDPNDSWLSLQLKGTCNIEQSAFNDWFTGHLNFQIEHHLFPTMPRHSYSKARPLVESLCRKHGIEYVVKPMGTAFKDVLVSLKASGEMWQEAYNEFKL